MSFLRSLMKKDGDSDKDKEKEQGKKTPIDSEAAGRLPEAEKKRKVNPLTAGDEAAPVPQSRRPKIPTKEQREFFNAARVQDSRVGQILSKAGLVNDEMIQEALGTEAGTTLQKSLVQHGFVREDDVLEAL